MEFCKMHEDEQLEITTKFYKELYKTKIEQWKESFSNIVPLLFMILCFTLLIGVASNGSTENIFNIGGYKIIGAVFLLAIITSSVSLYLNKLDKKVESTADVYKASDIKDFLNKNIVKGKSKRVGDFYIYEEKERKPYSMRPELTYVAKSFWIVNLYKDEEILNMIEDYMELNVVDVDLVERKYQISQEDYGILNSLINNNQDLDAVKYCMSIVSVKNNE